MGRHSGVQNMTVLQQWSDLRDPRPEATGKMFCVNFSQAAWYHCLRHWVNPKEPWKDVFGAQILAKLQAGSDATGVPDQKTVEDALRILHEECRESMHRPQVLFVRRDSHGKSSNWLLVLPSGSLTIMRGNIPSLRVVTCYFLAPVCVVNNGRQRWQVAVTTLIRRYVPLVGDPPQWLLPEENAAFDRIAREGQVVEHVVRRKFFTPETWGFCPDLRGCPWRGRLPTWPAAEKYARPQAARRKRWLKPPRSWDDNDDAPEGAHD